MKTYGDDPVDAVVQRAYEHEDGGCLRKREYFAAMAMHGMISQGLGIWGGVSGDDVVAEKACKLADALIAELNK